MQLNAPTMIETQTLRSYFCDELTRVIDNQSLVIDAEVFSYLTQLLTDFNDPSLFFEQTPDGLEFKPLALHYASAVKAETSQQRAAALRRLGDIALFISGLFPASLNRKVMDVDYYIAMGGTAYSYLHDVLDARVFGQLSLHFRDIVELLAEISENSALRNNFDLMREYEIWLHTGSPRALKKLRRQGLMPTGCNVSVARH